MSLAIALLHAPNIGVRKFKNHLSSYLNKAKTLIITDNGEPTSVVMPYDDVVELVDLIEELRDREVLELVTQGRKSISRGARGVSVNKVFKRIRRKK